MKRTVLVVAHAGRPAALRSARLVVDRLTAAGLGMRTWTVRRERFWASSLYICSFVFIIMVTAQFIYAKSASALSPATMVTFSNGQASIPLSQVADGHLHRYATVIDGTEVRFLLYQKPDGKIATVFDACEICGPVGFYESSQGLTCKNCAAPINPQSVGTPGGCNQRTQPCRLRTGP